MGLIDEILAADAAAFVDVDAMPGSEQLVYTKVGGTERTIYGNVTRQLPEAIDEGGQVFVPPLTIWVPNNTTNGIDPTEVNTGGDTITVAMTKGGAAVAIPILGSPISQDAGGCLWAVGNK
jgi:hypothetical protein